MPSAQPRRLALSMVIALVATTVCLGAAGTASAAPARGPWKFERISAHVQQAGRTSSEQTPMVYHGGVNGVAVTTGAPKVYLVFWGSQWGRASRNSQGWLRFSNDPARMAPILQRLYAGLGTDGEGWSTNLSQYCQGPSLAYGATTCADVAGVQNIPVPTNGVLANVWYDSSTSQPSHRATCTDNAGRTQQCSTGPTANALAGEALRAELHFNINSETALRDAQIVIVSPPNAHPDGFNLNLSNGSSDFCAWHDYTGSSDYSLARQNHPGTRTVAFTNLPYIPDAGAACGADFVSAATDGITIVASHEYAETLTDQYPEYVSGGWYDDGASGNEVADACSWNADTPSNGGDGAGAGPVTLATGTFVLEATWSNAADRCVLQAP